VPSSPPVDVAVVDVVQAMVQRVRSVILARQGPFTSFNDAQSVGLLKSELETFVSINDYLLSQDPPVKKTEHVTAALSCHFAGGGDLSSLLFSQPPRSFNFLCSDSDRAHVVCHSTR
jgi:hypothetical protein